MPGLDRLTPRAVRWIGFAGAVALGGAAYLGGVGFDRTVKALKLMPMLAGHGGALLPVLWVLGLGLLLLAWLAGIQRAPSVRWVLATVALWWVPVLPFLPLGSADTYSYVCQGYVQFAGGDPYAGGVQQFGCPWLSSVDFVWRDSPAPYGPVFLLLAAGAVAVAGTSLAAAIGALRAAAVAGLALLAAGLTVLARHAGVAPERAVWTVLACPLVLVHLVSGVHNDAVMTGLLVAALAVLVSRPSLSGVVAAGALLGLAAGVKATAAVVGPFMLVQAVRSHAWPRATLALGGGFVAAFGLVSVLAGRGLGWLQGLSRSGDTIAWTSPSTAAGLVVNGAARLFGADVDAIPVTRLIGWAVLAVALAVLWWRTVRGLDPMVAAAWALVLTVLCAPVFHPWYALWPLAVLAAVRPVHRAVLAVCVLACVLALPSGYNWALGTRLQGAVVLCVVLAVIVARGGIGTRRWPGVHKKDRVAL